MCGSLFVPLPLLLWPFFICPSTYSCWLPFWYLKTDTTLCNEKFVSNVRRCLLFNIKWTVFQLHSRREQAYKKYFNTTTKMSLGLRIWAKLLAICCRQKKRYKEFDGEIGNATTHKHGVLCFRYKERRSRYNAHFKTSRLKKELLLLMCNVLFVESLFSID